MSKPAERAWFMVRSATGKELFFKTLPAAYRAWEREHRAKHGAKK